MTPPTEWPTAATGTNTLIQVSSEGSGKFIAPLIRVLGFWSLVRQFFAGIIEWARSTINAAGWFAIGIATLGLLCGLIFGWIEIVFIGFAALVLVLLSIPFLFGAAEYRVTLRLENDRVVAGTQVKAELRIHNIAHSIALPSRMDIPVGDGLIDLPLPFLAPQQQWQQELEIPALKRGIINVGPVTTVKGDPIGLLSSEKTWAEVQQIYVHPQMIQLPSITAGFIRDLEGNPSRRIVDSDIAFHAIREYLPGDPIRHIHWKSTAKTNSLMVRQFEETRLARIVVVLSSNRDEYASDEEYELAVSTVASLGVRAIRDGREIEVITSLEVPELVKTSLSILRRLNVRSFRHLLDELAGVEPLENTSSLEELSRLTAQDDSAVSLAFLVCGSKVDVRRLRSAGRKFPIDSTIFALVCDEYAQPGIRTVGNLSVAQVAVLDDVKQLLTRVVISA